MFFPAWFVLSSSQTGVSVHLAADAAAGLGGSVGLPLSCCHGGGCSDAAARRAQPQQHHRHADCIHHPVLR